MAIQREKLVDELVHYISTEFLHDNAAKIDATTPLLEWGILTSLNIALLLTHIRLTHQVDITPEHLIGDDFKDVNSIVDLMARLDGAGFE